MSTPREEIKYLREELKKTTDENRKEEIKQRIANLRSGHICIPCCALPHEDFITAKKPKRKSPKEIDSQAKGCLESELTGSVAKLEEELKKTKDPKHRKTLKKAISLLKPPPTVEVCGPPPRSVRNRPITARKRKPKPKP